jgi:hypothetical protein
MVAGLKKRTNCGAEFDSNVAGTSHNGGIRAIATTGGRQGARKIGHIAAICGNGLACNFGDDKDGMPMFDSDR